MKKIMLLVPMILLSALLFCLPAHATVAEELPEQTQDNTNSSEGEKTPEGDAENPDGDKEAPEGDAENPDGDKETPEGDAENPDGDKETPEDDKETENVPQKTITVVDLKEDNLDRIIDIGQTPDFTNTEFIVTYQDGSFETVVFDESHLISWDAEKKGRQPAVLNIAGKEHIEYFIVSDPSIDINDFADVKKSYWGYNQIRRAVQAGFFVGMSKTEFGIKNGMTRAHFCQMIYNIYKADSTVFTDVKEAQFTDVAEGKWYYEAIMACARSGIVAGMGDGTFMPDAFISRQDVAVIMMSVLEKKETLDTLDVEKALEAARKNGIAAGDFDNVSPYAKKYVASALGVIFYGDSAGNLNPRSNITRTECAAMCSNLFFDNDKNETPEKKVVYLSPEGDKSKVYAMWKKNDPSTHEYTEHIQMSKIAEKTKIYLEAMGYSVYIADVETSIRDDNKYNSPPVVPDNIYCRAEEAYDMGAAVYVALHSNAKGGTNNGGAQGTRSFYNGTTPGSTELARAIHNRVSALTPTSERADAFQEDISYSATHGQIPYAEVWRPKMANILLEVEFHDYAPYAWWIVNNTDAIAKAVADGVDEYLKTLA